MVSYIGFPTFYSSKPSLSTIDITVTIDSSKTLESNVVKDTVKLWFPSKALSSDIRIFTHLIAPLPDSEGKISVDEKLV